MTTLKKRDVTIDIIKGIGIICMVIGHADSPFTAFIYSFHMPLFFIVSGYLFDTKNSQNVVSIKKYIARKAKGLYLPYCIWTIVFILCNNLFLRLNILTNNENLLLVNGNNALHQVMTIKEQIVEIGKAILFLGGTQLAGAFWFFRTLFFVAVIYCLIQFFIEKQLKQSPNCEYIQFGISILFCMLEQLFTYKNITFAGINYFFSYYIMFFIGHMFKKLDLDRFACKKYIFAISVAALFIVNIVQQRYSFDTIAVYFLKYITSFTGWIVMWNLAKWVSRFSNINKFLAFVGLNTPCIIIFHFLAFKLVSLIQVLVYSKPMYQIASFPVLSGLNGWWIVYSIVGVMLPLLLNLLYKTAKNKIIK